MKKIFIDANIWLDFYDTKSVKPLFKALEQVKDQIFVTQQVRDEVFRNRAKKTKDFLQKAIDANPSKCHEPTDYLIDEAQSAKGYDLREEIKQINKLLDNYNKHAKEIFNDTVGHVVRGKDLISKELQPYMANYVEPTEPELQRARKRKEFGNPPGKVSDSIGDELSWEQILSYADKHDTAFYIITRDEDYFVKDNWTKSNERHPNAKLADEIEHLTCGEFRFYDNLAKAIEDYKTLEKATVEVPDDYDAAAAEAELRQRAFDDCMHDVIQVQNGRFDQWVCKKCHKVLQTWVSDDICD